MREVKSWSDITVGQYQEMMLIETDNELTRFIECIAIALDCDPQEIRDMKYSDYSQLQAKMAFISKEPSKDIERIIEIDGNKYGLEPDMTLITAGVFIDGDQFRQQPIENLHNTLALIYRPITSLSDDGEYEIEPHKPQGFEKRANLFRDKVSIEVVLGATLFFSLLAMRLSIASLESFNEEILKKIQEEQKMMQTQSPTKKGKQKRSKKSSDSTTS